MTVYFMGGELASFIPSNSGGMEFTGSGFFDASFARCYISAGSSSAYYLDTPDMTLPDTFYVHFDLKRTSTASQSHTVLTLSTGGTEVARVTATNTVIQMQALISAAWTDVGDPVSWNGALTRETVDLYIDGNSATGTMTLYLGGTARASEVVDLSAVVGLDLLRLYGPYHAFSQVVVSDEPTIGWRLITRYPSGAGSDTAWTGDYTGVDETVNSDADFINSATANQVETSAQTGPAITGYTPRAVGVYVRAKRGASGPANLQLALRSAGTNYFSGSKALSVGYEAYGHIWDVNPATTADFLSSAIDALQPGVKSIT